jgi:AcrR family transcriptional regulator
MEKEKQLIPVKARIMELSFHAFNHKGYQSVSMDEIAKELRISKKTIYLHFSSKEELLESALLGLFAQIEAQLHGLERLRDRESAFQGYFGVFKAWKGSLTVALRKELQSGIPFLYDRIETFERQTLLRSFIGYLKELRDAKVIDYPSPSREFATTCFNMMNGILEASEEHAAFLLGTVFQGMEIKKKKKK